MEELEKEIVESREKIEFCRAKMQELVRIFVALFLCILLKLKVLFCLVCSLFVLFLVPFLDKEAIAYMYTVS